MPETRERINSYLNGNLEKLDELIAKHPVKIPVKDVAEFLQVDEESVRASIENGVFGMAWRRSGKLNKAFHIPTAQFVWWYTGVNPLNIV